MDWEIGNYTMYLSAKLGVNGLFNRRFGQNNLFEGLNRRLALLVVQHGKI